MSKEYIGVFFGNMYISQIQHGIQCGHTVTKLFHHYPENVPPNTSHLVESTAILKEWADTHVTKWLLDGGNYESLGKIYNIIRAISDVYPMPVDKFHESISALNGALTCVGLVVDKTDIKEELSAYACKEMTVDYFNELALVGGIDKDNCKHVLAFLLRKHKRA